MSTNDPKRTFASSSAERKGPDDAGALPLDIQVEVGGKLPATVELYPLPDDLLTEIAGARKYKYTVWNDQVLLVDPTNMVVADILHDYVLRDYEKKK